ncbi:SDR family NAD(P)-dependent oxidoreductase [Xanthomonas translucens]|uniref:SDR family NAD(P)-dependent oxidoreductase n=1 Tax=Xanthomonas campestris pv. translucens TaxID=343 RepID=UPI000641CC89|nr:SDR family oxidoreductase [Xanthomonas translucens]AKK67505.1 aklaviketone reductase [Xanthomonas translucens pv. undulosa]MCT8271072.1 SDR family oxidoreductase [Xanthomonas translucens pv. undulosa]QEO26254.1 SDR family oxidoreductase [Xanthomonas translucens pv. undulosa]UJB16682.1 SDR family oxidoreductase [Xanthomonas translucens pv. undulosa]UPU48021.1 SDR family oxidoreductase [Xanthomonas translucens pv. undulosa]
MSGTLDPEVLVLGGTGNIGLGVVRALLEAGSPVLAVARDRGRLRALRDRYSDEPALDVLQGSVCNDATAATLAAAVDQRPRPLAGVVASLGSPLRCGRLLDQPLTALRRRMEADLLPHLAAARHLLPLLAQAERGGRYILLGSPCALRAWAGHGESSVAAAAIRMLAQVLHEEAKPLGVRVQLLSLTHPVCRSEAGADACPEWFTTLSVGRAAVALLADAGVPGQAIVDIDKHHYAHPRTSLMTAPHFSPSTHEVSP